MASPGGAGVTRAVPPTPARQETRWCPPDGRWLGEAPLVYHRLLGPRERIADVAPRYLVRLRRALSVRPAYRSPRRRIDPLHRDRVGAIAARRHRPRAPGRPAGGALGFGRGRCPDLVGRRGPHGAGAGPGRGPRPDGAVDLRRAHRAAALA